MSQPIVLWIARVFLAGLTGFMLYSPYRFLSWAIPFSFSGPESWQTHWMVDGTVLVPFGTRLGQFLMWMPTVLATQAMILSAMWLVVMLLRGVYFEARMVKALQWVGLTAALAGASALVAFAFDAWIITGFNAKDRAPIRFHFDSGEIGVLLVGLGLYLLARVLHVTEIMNRENKEIV